MSERSKVFRELERQIESGQVEESLIFRAKDIISHEQQITGIFILPDTEREREYMKDLISKARKILRGER